MSYLLFDYSYNDGLPDEKAANAGYIATFKRKCFRGRVAFCCVLFLFLTLR